MRLLLLAGVALLAVWRLTRRDVMIVPDNSMDVVQPAEAWPPVVLLNVEAKPDEEWPEIDPYWTFPASRYNHGGPH